MDIEWSYAFIALLIFWAFASAKWRLKCYATDKTEKTDVRKKGQQFGVYLRTITLVGCAIWLLTGNIMPRVILCLYLIPEGVSFCKFSQLARMQDIPAAQRTVTAIIYLSVSVIYAAVVAGIWYVP
jgi:hypothetical protein